MDVMPVTALKGYGTVRTVVWEDGGGDPASYPISREIDEENNLHNQPVDPCNDFICLR
ncbi:MAG: hypothetical protein HXX11_15990 [Desulfuromonadales bacterium]|nr:hypothetical protein [Desulfuromonadales bacterium]